MEKKLTRHRDLVISNALETPTSEEIARLEAELGTSLPPAYRAFLDDANGGDLGFYYLDVHHPEMVVPRSFGFLYGTKPKSPGMPIGSFEFEIAESRTHAQLPREVLPFARDDSGCEVFLDLTAEGKGSVIAFIQGIEGWENQPKENAYVFIADSFEDYLGMLKLEKEFCAEQLATAVQQDSEAEISHMVQFLNMAYPEWRKDKAFALHKGVMLNA